MRAAIIGCGDVSVVHREAISEIEGAELVAVCDNDANRLANAASETGARAFSDHRDLLAWGEVDVVHVTTPHFQHAHIAVDALEAGIPVVLEKPLAHSCEAGARVVAASERPGAPKLGVCFQNRYNASSHEMRRLLDGGTCGSVLGAYASVVWARTAEYYRARPWRGLWAESGGGLMMNQAIHTLDLARWLLGPIASVTGRASTEKWGDVIEVEDTCQALFRHENGALTTWFASLTVPQHRPVELEIFCENAVLRLGDGLTVTWADGRVERTTERAVTSSGRSYWGVSHELLIRDFYRTLPDPKPFWITAREAYASLELVQNLYDQSFPHRSGNHR